MVEPLEGKFVEEVVAEMLAYVGLLTDEADKACVLRPSGSFLIGKPIGASVGQLGERNDVGVGVGLVGV